MLPLGATEPQLLTALWGGIYHLGFPLAFVLQYIYFIVIVMPSFNVAAFDQCDY